MGIRYVAACLAACAAFALGTARAEWYVFESGNPPRELLETSLQVSGYTGEITLSFLGDCTLGGEKKAASSRGGFVQTALREGYAYPFEKLLGILEADDVTVVNLEGVLTDRDLSRVKKNLQLQGAGGLCPDPAAGERGAGGTGQQPYAGLWDGGLPGHHRGAGGGGRFVF